MARPSRAAASLRFGVAIWSDIAKDAVHLLGKTFAPFLRHGMEDRLDMPLDRVPVVAGRRAASLQIEANARSSA
jgi:hypothetical protein